MTELRYTYLGDRWTAPALRGRVCGPVRRPDGRCVVGRSMGSALVEFVDGTRAVVRDPGRTPDTTPAA